MAESELIERGVRHMLGDPGAPVKPGDMVDFRRAAEFLLGEMWVEGHADYMSGIRAFAVKHGLSIEGEGET